MASSVTMRDIGRQLGCSAVTVSKALAGKSGVSEEMRQKIIRVAAEKGYVNPNAAPSRRSRGLDVGILTPEVFFSSDSFYAMFYKQLVQTLTDAGHFGLLELVSEEMNLNPALPNLLRSRHVDGLILLGQPSSAFLKLMVRQSVPVVCLDFYDTSVSVDAVVGDSACGAAWLTAHLISQGHREIGFVGDVKATSSIMERYLGFVSAMRMADLPVRPEYIFPDRDSHGQFLPITLPHPRPTALVCNCDVVARWVVDQLERQGLRVPEDISIVGYDDFENTPGLTPPLTTFRVNRQAMCQMAVRLLEQRCPRMAKYAQPVGRSIVGGECVFRDSVRALK